MDRNLLKMINLAVLVTFAVVIHTVEAALPLPMPVPGVRLGLANMITLLTLSLYGVRSGLVVAVLRTVLGSLIGGTFLGFGFWLGLSGGLLSTAVMALALGAAKRGYLTLISVSVLGAAAHNIAQITVAAGSSAAPHSGEAICPCCCCWQCPPVFLPASLPSILKVLPGGCFARPAEPVQFDEADPRFGLSPTDGAAAAGRDSASCYRERFRGGKHTGGSPSRRIGRSPGAAEGAAGRCGAT